MSYKKGTTWVYEQLGKNIIIIIVIIIAIVIIII